MEEGKGAMMGKSEEISINCVIRDKLIHEKRLVGQGTMIEITLGGVELLEHAQFMQTKSQLLPLI